MKINLIKNTPYNSINYSAQNIEPQKSASFCANPEKVASGIDKILKSKVAQGIFNFASMNPFGFNILALATTCIILRPPTVMVIPGSNKEDKQYVAAKSIIGSVVANTGRILLCLPLAKAIEKIG